MSCCEWDEPKCHSEKKSQYLIRTTHTFMLQFSMCVDKSVYSAFKFIHFLSNIQTPHHSSFFFTRTRCQCSDLIEMNERTVYNFPIYSYYETMMKPTKEGSTISIRRRKQDVWQEDKRGGLKIKKVDKKKKQERYFRWIKRRTRKRKRCREWDKHMEVKVWGRGGDEEGLEVIRKRRRKA